MTYVHAAEKLRHERAARQQDHQRITALEARLRRDKELAPIARDQQDPSPGATPEERRAILRREVGLYHMGRYAAGYVGYKRRPR